MNPLLAPLLRWFGRLRYPHLMLVVAGLFVVDLLVPDMIPLVDELLFGLGTVALAKWKNHDPPSACESARPRSILRDVSLRTSLC